MTSVVSILPPDNVKDALKNAHRPHIVTPENSSVVAAIPRTGPPTNFGHDMNNSNVIKSNVVGLFVAVYPKLYSYSGT